MGRLLRLDLLFTLSLFALMVVGCNKEPRVKLEPTLGITLNIPDNEDVVVRSVASKAELRVYSGYCFVFNSDGLYVTHQQFTSTSVTMNGTEAPLVSLPLENQITNGCKVVMILNQAPLDAENIGRPSFDELNDLFPLLPNTALVDGADAYTIKMPMYGFINSWSKGNKITMTRAMAKIQLKISEDLYTDASGGIGMANFNDAAQVKYKSFQYASHGNIKPGAELRINPVTSGLAEPIDGLDMDGFKVNNDVIVATDASDDYRGVSYIYEFNYATKIIGDTPKTIDVKTFARERLAIIVKAKNRFYRIDLCNKNKGTGVLYQDVIRNNHYSIIITGVKDNGYASITDAFLFPPSNLEYDIVHDPSENADITIDNGVYALTVESKSDNYISSTRAHICFNIMYTLGKTDDLQDIELPEELKPEFFVWKVENEDPESKVSWAFSIPTGTLTDKMSPLVWIGQTIDDVPGKAKITFRIVLGNLIIDRVVGVEILGKIE